MTIFTQTVGNSELQVYFTATRIDLQLAALINVGLLIWLWRNLDSRFRHHAAR